MTAESVVICIDNSAWSRNGDFTPTRLDAQKDAVRLYLSNKIRQNPENSFGLLSMSRNGSRLIINPISNAERVAQRLFEIETKNKCDFSSSLKTAQMALKNRINKSLQQRILLFVGSPVEESEETLEDVGRFLKKNNVSIDIITFGEVSLNQKKVNKLFQSVNNNQTSHLVELDQDKHALVDALVSSGIISGTHNVSMGGLDVSAALSGTSQSLNLDNQFDVDPELDPDLYMVLRLSFEEEQARLQRQNQENSSSNSNSMTNTETVAQTDLQTGQESFSSLGSGNTIQRSEIRDNIGINSDERLLNNGNNEESVTIAEIENMKDIDENLRNAVILSLQDSNSLSDTNNVKDPKDKSNTSKDNEPSSG